MVLREAGNSCPREHCPREHCRTIDGMRRGVGSRTCAMIYQGTYVCGHHIYHLTTPQEMVNPMGIQIVSTYAPLHILNT